MENPIREAILEALKSSEGMEIGELLALTKQFSPGDVRAEAWRMIDQGELELTSEERLLRLKNGSSRPASGAA
ncbi:hypothetical protein C4553_01445 [Candidatus Parcubacteria bacterium]|nr:MAG: hypothetical protein C4553_01445 [Candidatus Parcubacteria bacterium]